MNGHITQAEQNEVEAALKAAMTSIEKEPGAAIEGADWLSSRYPIEVKYYPHLDLTEVCGGSGWYGRPLAK